MFNDIKLNTIEKCPRCGEELTGWQTKNIWYSKYPIAEILMTIKINSRISGEAHTSCDNCGEWVDLEIEKGKIIKRAHYPTPRSRTKRQAGSGIET